MRTSVVTIQTSLRRNVLVTKMIGQASAPLRAFCRSLGNVDDDLDELKLLRDERQERLHPKPKKGKFPELPPELKRRMHMTDEQIQQEDEDERQIELTEAQAQKQEDEHFKPRSAEKSSKREVSVNRLIDSGRSRSGGRSASKSSFSKLRRSPPMRRKNKKTPTQGPEKPATIKEIKTEPTIKDENAVEYRIEHNKRDKTIVMHPVGKHRFSLIWLHGIGHGGDVYVDIFKDQKFMRLPPGVRIILPTAPSRVVAATKKKERIPAWYDIMSFTCMPEDLDIEGEFFHKNFKQTHMHDCIDFINRLIKREVSKLGDAKYVFLGGFSQGGSIALATYLMSKVILGGLVSCSTLFCTNINWNRVNVGQKKKTPVFIYHGASDPVIQPALAQLGYDILRNNGITHFQMHTEEGLVHSISDREKLIFTSFFASIMKKYDVKKTRGVQFDSKVVLKDEMKRHFQEDPSSYKRSGKYPYTAYLDGGRMMIQVCFQDITEENAEAITSSANTMLTHSQGIPQLIRDAAGEEYERDVGTYLERYGKLQPGEVGVSGAGNLMATYVLHAVGPLWNDQESSEGRFRYVKQLNDAVLATLSMAEYTLGCKSVSLPAIGTDVHKFPPPLCATVTFQAIIQYLKERREKMAKDPDTKISLMWISISNGDKDVYEAFKNEFNRIFPVTNTEHNRIPMGPSGESLNSFGHAERKKAWESARTVLYTGTGQIERPRINTYYLRLYGHNLDPFVAQARYTLSAYKIEFQECAIDMENIAKWHKDLNKGRVPLLEFPDGKRITGGNNIINFILAQGKAQEDLPDLIPVDPQLNAEIQVKIDDFMKKISPIYAMFLSRGQNMDVIETFIENELALHEAMATEPTKSRYTYLLATEEITLLDIMVGPFWEMIYNFQYGYMMDETWHRLKLRSRAPNMFAYIDKFRNHWAVKGRRMNDRIAENYWRRARIYKQHQDVPFSTKDYDRVIYEDVNGKVAKPPKVKIELPPELYQSNSNKFLVGRKAQLKHKQRKQSEDRRQKRGRKPVNAVEESQEPERGRGRGGDGRDRRFDSRAAITMDDFYQGETQYARNWAPGTESIEKIDELFGKNATKTGEVKKEKTDSEVKIKIEPGLEDKTDRKKKGKRKKQPKLGDIEVADKGLLEWEQEAEDLRDQLRVMDQEEKGIIEERASVSLSQVKKAAEKKKKQEERKQEAKEELKRQEEEKKKEEEEEKKKTEVKKEKQEEKKKTEVKEEKEKKPEVKKEDQTEVKKEIKKEEVKIKKEQLDSDEMRIDDLRPSCYRDSDSAREMATAKSDNDAISCGRKTDNDAISCGRKTDNDAISCGQSIVVTSDPSDDSGNKTPLQPPKKKKRHNPRILTPSISPDAERRGPLPDEPSEKELRYNAATAEERLEMTPPSYKPPPLAATMTALELLTAEEKFWGETPSSGIDSPGTKKQNAEEEKEFKEEWEINKKLEQEEQEEADKKMKLEEQANEKAKEQMAVVEKEQIVEVKKENEKETEKEKASPKQHLKRSMTPELGAAKSKKEPTQVDPNQKDQEEPFNAWPDRNKMEDYDTVSEGDFISNRKRQKAKYGTIRADRKTNPWQGGTEDKRFAMERTSDKPLVDKFDDIKSEELKSRSVTPLEQRIKERNETPETEQIEKLLEGEEGYSTAQEREKRQAGYERYVKRKQQEREDRRRKSLDRISGEEEEPAPGAQKGGKNKQVLQERPRERSKNRALPEPNKNMKRGDQGDYDSFFPRKIRPQDIENNRRGRGGRGRGGYKRNNYNDRRQQQTNYSKWRQNSKERKRSPRDRKRSSRERKPSSRERNYSTRERNYSTRDRKYSPKERKRSPRERSREYQRFQQGRKGRTQNQNQNLWDKRGKSTGLSPPTETPFKQGKKTVAAGAPDVFPTPFKRKQDPVPLVQETKESPRQYAQPNEKKADPHRNPTPPKRKALPGQYVPFLPNPRLMERRRKKFNKPTRPEPELPKKKRWSRSRSRSNLADRYWRKGGKKFKKDPYLDGGRTYGENIWAPIEKEVEEKVVYPDRQTGMVVSCVRKSHELWERWVIGLDADIRHAIKKMVQENMILVYGWHNHLETEWCEDLFNDWDIRDYFIYNIDYFKFRDWSCNEFERILVADTEQKKGPWIWIDQKFFGSWAQLEEAVKNKTLFTKLKDVGYLCHKEAPLRKKKEASKLRSWENPDAIEDNHKDWRGVWADKIRIERYLGHVAPTDADQTRNFSRKLGISFSQPAPEIKYPPRKVLTLRARINETLKTSDICMFSKSDDNLCSRAKKIFAEKNIWPNVVEIDQYVVWERDTDILDYEAIEYQVKKSAAKQHEFELEIRRIIKKPDAQVPYIFVGGKYIGSYVDLLRLSNTDRLKDLLKTSGIYYREEYAQPMLNQMKGLEVNKTTKKKEGFLTGFLRDAWDIIRFREPRQTEKELEVSRLAKEKKATEELYKKNGIDIEDKPLDDKLDDARFQDQGMFDRTCGNVLSVCGITMPRKQVAPEVRKEVDDYIKENGIVVFHQSQSYHGMEKLIEIQEVLRFARLVDISRHPRSDEFMEYLGRLSNQQPPPYAFVERRFYCDFEKLYNAVKCDQLEDLLTEWHAVYGQPAPQTYPAGEEIDQQSNDTVTPSQESPTAPTDESCRKLGNICGTGWCPPKSNPETREFLLEQIKKHPILIFMQNYCETCQDIKKVLKAYNIMAKIVLLDEETECDDYYDELEDMTGQYSCPFVFIGGEFIGEHLKMIELAKKGKLLPLLKKAGVPHSDVAWEDALPILMGEVPQMMPNH